MNDRGNIVIPAAILLVGLLIGVIVASALIQYPAAGNCPRGTSCQAPCPSVCPVGQACQTIVTICGDGVCSVGEDCLADCIVDEYGY